MANVAPSNIFDHGRSFSAQLIYIIHVYKNDSKLKCSNYNPIFLLSNIYKVLERLMYNQLYNYLELNSVI